MRLQSQKLKTAMMALAAIVVANLIDFGGQSFSQVELKVGTPSVEAKTRRRVNASDVKSKRVRARAAKATSTTLEKPKAATLPRAFVDERVTRILRDLKGRAPRARSAEALAVSLPAWASKSQWLQAVYSKQLVDASNSTGLLSDKLLFYEVAKRELGPAVVDRYVVRTVGLRDFLVSEGLVDADGRLIADGDKIDSSLFKIFQSGFVARPAVGVASRETGRGLFKESDEFVTELIKPDSFLYRPDHRKRPVRSTMLDEIASGEAIVLQEDLLSQGRIASVAGAKAGVQVGAASPTKPGLVAKLTGRIPPPPKPLGARAPWREVRVHTYESRVVTDANPNFWVREGRATKQEIAAAQKFVAEFLGLLPQTLLSRQALSFDVLVLESGELKIVDLVTNRGRKVGWSGYLDQPRVIGAYARHFEQYAGVRFSGLSGYMIRKNAGNYFAYWGLRIEKSRPGLEKVLAWIPPWP
jgi:hypothetical protein